MSSNGNDCLTTSSNDIDLACKYYVNDYDDNNFKFYIHPIFSKYAASKEGEILNVKTGRI